LAFPSQPMPSASLFCCCFCCKIINRSRALKK
jgi:hypothetical protein